MTTGLFYVIPLIYAGYVALDIISIFPRIAGSVVQKNGIAYSFQQMTNTVKRIFVVLYPPLLGLISINGTLNDMFRVVFLSYFVSVVVCVSVYLLRVQIVAIFCGVLESFAHDGRLIQSFLAGFRKQSNWTVSSYNIVREKVPNSSHFPQLDKSIVVTAVWIFFFYSATPFLINVLSMKYSGYSSIILQLTGLSSALGTLALAFLLDPKLSRIYEDQREVPIASRSLLLSHMINLTIAGPVFFITASFLIL